MEVIYTGLHQTPEQVMETAIQEDVDVIGLSLLSGAHMTLFPMVQKLLKEHKIDNIMIIGGGIIPEEDSSKLKQAGIAEIFGPGTNTKEIVNFIVSKVKK